MDQNFIIGAVAVVFIALVVALAALAAIVAILLKRDKRRKDDLKHIVTETVSSAFKRETRRLSKMYAEEQRVAKWVKELSKKDELDVSKLATETERRAYVFALKKADDAVVLAETHLENIRQELRKEQRRLFNHTENENLFNQSKQVIAYLSEQEDAAEERVKVMRERLLTLTSDLSSGKLDAVLTDFDAAAVAENTPAGIVLPDYAEPLTPENAPELKAALSHLELLGPVEPAPDPTPTA